MAVKLRGVCGIETVPFRIPTIPNPSIPIISRDSYERYGKLTPIANNIHTNTSITAIATATATAAATANGAKLVTHVVP